MRHFHMVVSQVTRNRTEHNKPLHRRFADREKSDSVDTNAVKTYEDILEDIYKVCTGRIIPHQIENFPIRKTIRQENTTPPKLFTDSLEEEFEKTDREKSGTRRNREYLSHLRFAEDCFVCKDSIQRANNASGTVLRKRPSRVRNYYQEIESNVDNLRNQIPLPLAWVSKCLTTCTSITALYKLLELIQNTRKKFGVEFVWAGLHSKSTFQH